MPYLRYRQTVDSVGNPGGNVKKKGAVPYRSANFSTTRTLSPRTVIGIGTTLS
jgi:hypothetical protein